MQAETVSERVPRFSPEHRSEWAPLDVDEVERFEHPERLAERRPRDSERSGELSLRGQAPARNQSAAQESSFELVDDLLKGSPSSYRLDPSRRLYRGHDESRPGCWLITSWLLLTL